MADKPEKKLIIDEDWKQEAQREKEVLAEKERQEKQTQAATGRTGPLPPADLPGLISMLATQAFFALGVVRSREDEEQEPEPDLEMAKYHIDLLAMLEEKTQGNLSVQEKRLLDDSLHQLRMAYVQISEHKAS